MYIFIQPPIPIHEYSLKIIHVRKHAYTNYIQAFISKEQICVDISVYNQAVRVNFKVNEINHTACQQASQPVSQSINQSVKIYIAPFKIPTQRRSRPR